MKKNLLLIVLLMILIPLAGYSQNETKTQFTVAGVIVDASGEPLVGTAAVSYTHLTLPTTERV